MTNPKYVYLFEEAVGTDKKLLGGKGAGLAEMTRMGLPVPPGSSSPRKPVSSTTRTGKSFPKTFWKKFRQN